MELTTTKIFQSIVSAGMKNRYGEKPCTPAMMRYLWEMKHIIEGGYADSYLLAFWIFRMYADPKGIGFRARGAVSSSIVCYAITLTDVDPLVYGLHSVRFVNEEPPKFQFDIESSRFEEFIKGANECIDANAGIIDVASVKAFLFKDLKPMDYLSRKRIAQLPESLDEEIARYALSFPATMALFDTYISRKNGTEWSPTGIDTLDEILASTYGLLVYQEQMLDILKTIFKYSAIERNNLRLAIQRGDIEQMASYKADLHNHLKGITSEESATVWNILTSNPRAFLKAHAVSQVIKQYKYEVY